MHETTHGVIDDPRVATVRVLFSDLHGVARGKDVPVAEFPRVAAHGLAFCSAIMATDLRHTPVRGAEEGFPDLLAMPDPATLLPLPWEPTVTACLADLQPAPGGRAVANPRGAVRRAAEALNELGFVTQVGPELEFFLLEGDPGAPGGVRRRVDRPSMVYTVGPQADPGGFVRSLTEQLTRMGLGAVASHHEFMNGQYEINLRHGDALDAADRAFLLKSAVKDVAALDGLVATFMGKPFNDQGGSGLHLHVSLHRDGANAFAEPGAPDGVSPELRRFAAGVIHHAPAVMALLNPTINAYRRTVRDSLAPTHANWGWDNRTVFARVPPERGAGTRVEFRVGDAAANPYLAIAAILHAGAHGVRDEIELAAAVSGDGYRAAGASGVRLPRSLEESLDALEADAPIAGALGPEIVEPFVAMKRSEVERHRAHVSEWELDEYLHHL